MPFQKGRAKTGGRVKGVKNKIPRARAEVVEHNLVRLIANLPEEIRNVTPLEALLICMRWSLATNDRNGVLLAAQAAAPYIHPRLATAEVRIYNPAAGLTDEELKVEIAKLEARIKGDETIH